MSRLLVALLAITPAFAGCANASLPAAPSVIEEIRRHMPFEVVLIPVDHPGRGTTLLEVQWILVAPEETIVHQEIHYGPRPAADMVYDPYPSSAVADKAHDTGGSARIPRPETGDVYARAHVAAASGREIWSHELRICC